MKSVTRLNKRIESLDSDIDDQSNTKDSLESKYGALRMMNVDHFERFFYLNLKQNLKPNRKLKSKLQFQIGFPK